MVSAAFEKDERNPTIMSFAVKHKLPHGLPYRGIGTGIKRALSLYPKIEFLNGQDSNLFKGDHNILT
jgi:ATP-dependent DNA helicase RecG